MAMTAATAPAMNFAFHGPPRAASVAARNRLASHINPPEASASDPSA